MPRGCAAEKFELEVERTGYVHVRMVLGYEPIGRLKFRSCEPERSVWWAGQEKDIIEADWKAEWVSGEECVDW